jgi:CRP/FNR family transcriptional activator FtrB
MPHLDPITVRSFRIFRKLAASSVQELLQGAEIKRLARNTAFLREGETPKYFYLLADGIVELFASHDGDETTIDLVKRGNPVVVGDVIHNLPCVYSARTLVPSQVLIIPAETLRHICDHDASLAAALLFEIAEHHRFLIRQLKDIKLRSSAERLANWILRAVPTHGDNRSVALMCEKRTIASHLGMSPENFSRNMALLTRHGVRNAGRDIIVENVGALTRFANPSALMDG